MAIPVIITAGFLGCGKTSFLRHLLPLCGEVGKKPALIINEVGDVDVDGELLADLHAEQVRLVGGCVCCTLQSQLSETIYQLIEQKAYDLIIIECSGLSNPIDVVTALSAPALLKEIAVSHIISLVDAGRAERVLASDLAKTQVQSADIVIINKMDTLPESSRASVEKQVGELSENAAKYQASYGDIGKDALVKILTDAPPARCSCGCGHDHSHSHDHHHEHTHALPASFCTVALDLPALVQRPAMENLLKTLPKNVIRAKGFAFVEDEGWQVLHKVYDMIDMYPLYGGAPSIGAVLVCIGQHLSTPTISGLVSTLSPTP